MTIDLLVTGDTIQGIVGSKQIYVITVRGR